MSEPTAGVFLTLEESGSLCHVVLATMVQRRKIKPSGSLIADVANDAFTCALKSAYPKLTAANDLLMGKT